MKAPHANKNSLIALAIAGLFQYSSASLAVDTSALIGKDLDQNQALVAATMQGRNYLVQVDGQGKIKQVIDTGANGDGTDPLAANHGGSQTTASNGAMELPVNYQGQYAIDRLGVDLASVADSNGLTPDKLKDMLLNDETLRIDSNGKMFYVDNHGDSNQVVAGLNGVTTANGATAAASTAVPMSITTDVSKAFLMHSKPGASKVLYLDFDGHVATATAWSSGTINAPAYDLSGNPAVFDTAERTDIIKIWNRVAEDYAPFDVDVTTELPTNDALLRTSSADTAFGTRVVITKKSIMNCGCGGVAYVGVNDLVGGSYYQPAWVFQDALANNEKYIAEAASHEAGHNLGLNHDGQNPSTGYYSGHGAGDTGWAPIMGVGYYKNVTQWSAGIYPSANNQQDDVGVLASHGLVARADDFGNTTATASSLTNIGTAAAPTIENYGVIETANDVDMFVISTNGGVVNLTASPAALGPNLDLKLTLYNASGAVVSVNAPEASLSATINQTLAAGTYYLAVANSAHAASGADYGYPAYGSLGQYKVTGTYAGNGSAAAPVANITASALTGQAPFTVNFSANNSVGNGNITGYNWTFGDNTSATTSNPVHTFNTVGTYTTKLTVTNQYNLTSTKTVTVTVTAPPTPSMWVSTVGVSGSISGKTLKVNMNLVVIDSKGKVVPNATVKGTFTGSLSGVVTSVSAANGLVTQSATTTKLSGGSATYTINSITADGYIYDATKNARSVLNLTW